MRSAPIAGAQAALEPVQPADEIDFAAALDSLRRDPVLRYSDEGRTLLRWLDSRAVRREEARFVGRVPPHQATLIAKVARGCAAFRERVAADLEWRGAEGAPHAGR